MASERILVTGATGFLGSHVVIKALENGYAVRGTVRSPSQAKEVRTFWTSYGDRFDSVVVPDLVEGDYTEALKGALHFQLGTLTAILLHLGISAVIHVASPFFRSVNDPRKDLLDPARQGTVKVLEACLKHGVQRVVVTGSIAAVIDSAKGGKLPIMPPSICCDLIIQISGVTIPIPAEDWNSLTYEQAVSGALPGIGVYAVSKKIAEMAAFEFAREHPAMHVTVMSPTMIFGPLVLPADLSALNTSSQDIYNLISGKLEDTALPACTDSLGRGFLFNGAMFTFYEAVNILSKQRPNLIPRLPSLDGAELKVTSKKAKIDVSIAETELGIKWTSFEQCLLDTVDEFIRIEAAAKL
ncbi:uncharacterized protein EV420DRAFT_1646850 [Desarmillaria tabescens]|uniref:NAD-dependent epimerase/dehydratase domain-containing protein n=1 Tax=Armillaria tabescens TaxID=1929756 RepID=A0AA39MXM7_ARMTA|nr:uncharacterized protein EV420DRAFT_1646850 [Desarmillaria tabescens]KAK0449854.1 hypothetical protein EV420DRAFT_1646850 [Desarmillaria tabescens]